MIPRNVEERVTLLVSAIAEAQQSHPGRGFTSEGLTLSDVVFLVCDAYGCDTQAVDDCTPEHLCRTCRAKTATDSAVASQRRIA